MMRHKFTIGAFAVAFALSTLPAAGQEKGGGSQQSGSSGSGSAGSRSAGSGSATGGTAVSRGGGGADSGGSSSRSSGGGMSGGSMGSSSSPSMPSSSGSGAAPMRSFDRAPQRANADSGQSRPAGSRSSGGESTGRSAVPRGSSASGSGSSSREGGSVRSGGSTGSTASREVASGSGSETGRRAVPAYSRPRDGRPTTGVAVDRGLAPTHPITGIPGDIYYIYRPYYYPYGFWGSAYGFGLGYLYYDPFWYGGGGYGYPGYGYGGSYSSGGYSQTYHDTGNLRLKIKPREAQVYVDGYFVGVVDSFDGSFQRLSLDGGTHKVEIKADGYEPLQLDVVITPGETVTYKGDLTRIR